MHLRRIDHVGIAVQDEDEARRVLEAIFGCQPPHQEVVEQQGVRTLIYRVGDAKIELLLPTRGDTPLAKHMQKRGGGLHHLAFEVDDLALALEEAEAMGLRPLDAKPQPGVEGSRIAFLHPKDTFRTLVELVEFPDDLQATGGP